MKNIQTQPNLQVMKQQKNMALDLTQLNAAVDGLTTEVTADEKADSDATTLINGIVDIVAKAVTAALEADNAANQGTINNVAAAIDAARTRLNAAAVPLAAATLANTPSA